MWWARNLYSLTFQLKNITSFDIERLASLEAAGMFRLEQVYCFTSILTKMNKENPPALPKFSGAANPPPKFFDIIRDSFRCVYLTTPTLIKKILISFHNNGASLEVTKKFIMKAMKLIHFASSFLVAKDSHISTNLRTLNHLLEVAKADLEKVGILKDFETIVSLIQKQSDGTEPY
mmetsp:Transcript_25425/g.39212  ORF Transcript_25425/g.39212 Transcript_25425/m.39212 type:complete len:176 (-) Transcript_25425:332-859(-)